jgi:DnaJ-class molecular chaperone
MINYYKILGVNKLCKNEEIEKRFLDIKKSLLLNDSILEAYNILKDYHSRRKYDELLEKKSRYSIFNIPFFGYDFDEQIKNNEMNIIIKKYKIEENKYLIYEKKNIDGNLIKTYYIEINGKTEIIPEKTILELKNEYYEKHKRDPLKDKYINRVLTK